MIGAAASPSAPCLLYVPVPSLEEGRTLARTLVTEKLAACINILPQVHSIYSWEGTLQETQEVILFIKTLASHKPKIVQRLRVLHSNTCPVILPITLEEVPQPVLAWLHDTLGERDAHGMAR